MTINCGGAAKTMGGGKPILIFTSTLAIVGIGTTIMNAKSIVAKSNFFISLHPCGSNSAWGGFSGVSTSPPARVVYLCLPISAPRVIHINLFPNIRRLRQGHNPSQDCHRKGKDLVQVCRTAFAEARTRIAERIRNKTRQEATTISGQPEPVAHTDPAATKTKRFVAISFREHSHTDLMFTSSSR
jgi:hypothetical protein